MSCCVLVVSGYSVVCSFSSSFCAGSQATTFTDGRFIITIEWSNKSETLWNVAHCSCFLIQPTHTQHWSPMYDMSATHVPMLMLFNAPIFTGGAIFLSSNLILFCHCSVFNIFYKTRVASLCMCVCLCRLLYFGIRSWIW